MAQSDGTIRSSQHRNSATQRYGVLGTHGVVTCSNWLACEVGMRMLEIGGNAFDAAVAIGLVLPVVEPQECGLGGEVVILLLPSAIQEPLVLCGQGTAPAAATIAHFRGLGLDSIPSRGPLAAVVPGAFDAWMVLSKDYGKLGLEQVMAPAIGYASRGFPVYRAFSEVLAARQRTLREWPTTRMIFLPRDAVPVPGQLFANPALARTYQRLLHESSGPGRTRDGQIEAARRAFYQGFVAEAIDAFVSGLEFRAANGTLQKGVLAAHDLALWRATYEPPVSYRFHDTIVFKAGPWSQGPVLLQMLALLRHSSILDMNPLGADFIHTFVETSKLAFADREGWYGDSQAGATPISHLLSEGYNEQRSRLIGPSASDRFEPGTIEGRAPAMPLYGIAPAANLNTGAGSPSDTCHVDVIDRWGNIVSATPSGGWFTAGPTIPDLGFALSTRAQQFWLQEGLASSLEPGKRPRTTLSPTLALDTEERWVAFGARGSDRADQWALQFLLKFLCNRWGMQQAIDAPMFYSEHWPLSVFPRQASPRKLVIQQGYPFETVDALERRGHSIVRPFSRYVPCLSAASRAGTVLQAAASTYVSAAAALGR